MLREIRMRGNFRAAFFLEEPVFPLALTECGGCPSATDTTTRQQGWLSILLKENGYSGNRRKVTSLLQLRLADTSLCQRCRLLCRMQATLTVSFMYPHAGEHPPHFVKHWKDRLN